VQLYKKGIEGHCAYNRKAGAKIENHPEKPENKVMHLFAEYDSTLLAQNSGAVFNFPAGSKGELTIRFKKNPGFEGMNVSLHDRWFNPSDSSAQQFAMFNTAISTTENDEEWHELKMKWVDAGNRKNGRCELYLDGRRYEMLAQRYESHNGISYIHFYLPLINEHNGGILMESIHVKTSNN
jgi:hypothetical protein